MSRSSLLILLGLLTMLAPYSGLPISWRSFAVLVCGFVIVLLGFSIRAQRVREAVAQDKSVPVSVDEHASAPVVPHGVSPI